MIPKSLRKGSLLGPQQEFCFRRAFGTTVLQGAGQASAATADVGSWVKVVTSSEPLLGRVCFPHAVYGLNCRGMMQEHRSHSFGEYRLLWNYSRNLTLGRCLRLWILASAVGLDKPLVFRE